MRNARRLSLLLDRRLEPLCKLVVERPPQGWARAIRDALGMTKSQLARRMGVSSSTVAELERSEVRETITLASLRRLAKGLDCRVVYALVPNGADSLEVLVRDRAESLVSEQVPRGLRGALVTILTHGGRKSLWG